jgi:hypothetical protein
MSSSPLSSSSSCLRRLRFFDFLFVTSAFTSDWPMRKYSAIKCKHTIYITRD